MGASERGSEGARGVENTSNIGRLWVAVAKGRGSGKIACTRPYRRPRATAHPKGGMDITFGVRSCGFSSDKQRKQPPSSQPGGRLRICFLDKPTGGGLSTAGSWTSGGILMKDLGLWIRRNHRVALALELGLSVASLRRRRRRFSREAAGQRGHRAWCTQTEKTARLASARRENNAALASLNKRHHLGREPHSARLRPCRRSQRGGKAPLPVPRTAAAPGPALFLRGKVRPHATPP